MNETGIAVILIVLGMLGLGHGGFDYYQVENAAVGVGILAGSESVNTLSVSFYLGIGALIGGILLLIFRIERSPK